MAKRRVPAEIRRAITKANYDFTDHALDEMMADGLWPADVESAVPGGRIAKVETDDPRGPRYTIVGPSEDGSQVVGVVGRFTETAVYLIVTVYEVKDPEEE